MNRLPEQLFFPTALAAQSNFFSLRPESIFTNKIQQKTQDLATGFVYFLDPFWVAVLGKACRLCACVCVWVSDTIG